MCVCTCAFVYVCEYVNINILQPQKGWLSTKPSLGCPLCSRIAVKMSGLCRSGARLFINTFGILCDLLARSGIVWAKGPGSEESGSEKSGSGSEEPGSEELEPENEESARDESGPDGLRMRSLLGMNLGLLT